MIVWWIKRDWMYTTAKPKYETDFAIYHSNIVKPGQAGNPKTV